jgi:hypothetical protein
MAKNKLTAPVALPETRELSSTLVIDDYTYNINAVEADTAKKVNNKLTINEIDFDGNIVPAVEFDGSEDKEISVIPSTGGHFTGRIEVPTLGVEGPAIIDAYPDAVLNCKDIKSYVVSSLLDNSVLFQWDGINLNDAESGNINNIALITGTEANADKFAKVNFNSKKFSAYIYIATATGYDTDNIYFGTSTSDKLFGVRVRADNANTANKLTTSRDFLVKLDSNVADAFDGTENATPGVSGTLAIKNGGTGAATAAAARTSLGITPANIGAATASHNQAAETITSGTLSYDRLPVVPEAKGGTGATSLINVTVGNALNLGNNLPSYYQKKITLSTASPSNSDGSNGDIWIVYK